MSHIDKKDHALVTQQLKRSKRTGAQHYTLPKPYRRTPGPDERQAMSKSTLAMIALAGLLIAGLIAELVAIVQENIRVRKLPVIAAIVPEVRPTVLPAVAVPPVMQEMAPVSAPAVQAAETAKVAAHPEANPEVTSAVPPEIASEMAPALAPVIAPAPAALEPSPERDASAPGDLLPDSSPAPRRSIATVPAALPFKKPRPARIAPKPAVVTPAPDPDVVLVTAILMLTAKPELSERVSVCDPGMAKEATCTDIHGMVP